MTPGLPARLQVARCDSLQSQLRESRHGRPGKAGSVGHGLKVLQAVGLECGAGDACRHSFRSQPRQRRKVSRTHRRTGNRCGQLRQRHGVNAKQAAVTGPARELVGSRFRRAQNDDFMSGGPLAQEAASRAQELRIGS